jgi:hyperosmotically inducible periplasmic protein
VTVAQRTILLIALLLAASACGMRQRAVAEPGITPAAASDLELVARVKTALLNDAIVGNRRIDVQASLGDVRLSGRVATAAERDRALELTRAVAGVRTVSSDLVIQP